MTATKTYALYLGIDSYLYLAPRLPKEYECGRDDVPESVVLDHLHQPPTRPVRFTRADQSYGALAAELER